MTRLIDKRDISKPSHSLCDSAQKWLALSDAATGEGRAPPLGKAARRRGGRPRAATGKAARRHGEGALSKRAMRQKNLDLKARRRAF